MSRLRLVVGATVLLALGAQAGADLARGIGDWSRLGPLPPGSDLPDFRVRTLAGASLESEDLRGKVSVVTFWASWCGVCEGELGDLDELDDRYVDDPNVQFVAVNREGGNVPMDLARRRAQGFVAAHELGLPVVMDDGTMSRSFRVSAIPHTVLLDRRGTLRHVHQGRVSASTIADEIADLLAE
jgi:thiol-disulfide isomerase/thioredoxin